MKASQVSNSELVDTGRRKKAAKGTVKIEVDKGWLRLRFSYRGKRHTIGLGLIDSKLNREVAADKARRIELDILSENFDETLAKYKPQIHQTTSKSKSISIKEVMERFIKHKSKFVYVRTLEKYKALLNHLRNFQIKDGKEKISFADTAVVLLDQNLAEQFYGYLEKQQADRTFKEALGLLTACWEWGMSERLWEGEANPWEQLVKRVKVAPKQKPKPFNREEITAIAQAFRNDSNYYYYADYVEFLLGTGCRTAEAIGLRWKHLSDDFSNVWFGETLSRGVRKATKTNKARTIRLNSRLQSMLKAKKSTDAEPDDLVFTTPRGNRLDDHNFRNRAWKPMLENLGIPYRKPYNTRHTAISHALDAGMNPVAVSEVTGHDVRTLYRDYAANVRSSPIDFIGNKNVLENE
ncbi:MAG: tyrosine-type recombinase/integrase [Leptolyngbyaceae cyanobacterium bins.302]|nr:tyrosine-type recombinase/integrase [Leptolyngbyaceae cyanobacterium bins.302]